MEQYEDQPTELREYLTEAEAVVTEWYSRAGVEASHESNIDKLSALLGLRAVMEPEKPFAAFQDAARLYLIAAFQMGRAQAYGDHSRDSE